MTDTELARALERCEIPNEGFPHVSHLRVAWVYLEECAEVEEACGRMAATLRRFATAVGKPEKYHETITVFWIRALAAARSAVEQRLRQFEDVLAGHPELLDKDLLLAYYSPQRLASGEARSSWIEPDRRPLTFDVPAPHSSDSSGDAPDRALSGRSA
jgi:hypothetical protein